MKVVTDQRKMEETSRKWVDGWFDLMREHVRRYVLKPMALIIGEA